MKVLSINRVVYRVKNEDFDKLMEAADAYTKSLYTSSPDCSQFVDTVEYIEKKYKPVLYIDNGFNT